MIDVTELFAAYQLQKRLEDGPKPTAAGTLMRCSDAGSCIRKRGFAAIEAPETEEIGPETLLAFEIGNSIHEVLQEAFLNDPGLEVEVETPIDLSHLGVSLSGHTDGIITMPNGTKIILEIKTMSGFGAKMHFRGEPKREHVAQAGLYALGVEADGILLVYVSKESDFRSGIRPGQIAQWYYGLDDEVFFGESVRSITEDELSDCADIESIVKNGMIPAPLVPNDTGAKVLVEDPPDYGGKGSPWNCRYCLYNSLCRTVGPGDVSIDIVRRISA